MGLFNHITLGDIQNHVYLEGKILAVYLESHDVDAAIWDTADVEYENHKVFLNAPVRYHCLPVGIERANGAIADGARGFDVGDKVILMAKIGSTPQLGEEYEKVYVVAHREGVVPCTYNFVLIRMSAGAFIPHNPPYGTWVGGAYLPNAPGSHLHEYCTVWDAAKGATATVYNPVTALPYVFPLTVEEFKPALDYYRFVDEELFTLTLQGDEQIQEAGFTPDWRSDVQGEKIRNGAAPSAWWTSYDIYANPIFSLLLNTQMALATDSAGAADGTFAKAMAKFDAGRENIAGWKAASPQAFNDDTRLFDVTGSSATQEMTPETLARLQELQALIGQMNDLIGTLDSVRIARWETLAGMIGEELDLSPALRAEAVALENDLVITRYGYLKGVRDTAQTAVDSILGKSAFTPWEIAHDKDMKPLRGSSYHMQNAYGEDEIWVCGKNVYQGMVVSACDSAWKFLRLPIIPPALPIGNPAAGRLASGSATVGGLAFGSAMSLSDISFAMASDIMIRDDNNIFSYGTLKRINDGGFHRTTHPALRSAGVGSFRMTQALIPGSPAETVYTTALNTRYEHIDVWNRYDNWMNSFPYSCASWGVDRTWWFKSYAMQWRIKAAFIDTPIGSMWHASPIWEVGLWSMTGFSVFDGGPICRRDAPLRTHFIRQTKHSKRVILQIYLIQRQAVTMWDDPTRTFVKQELNKGIYDHFPTEDIKYVDAQGDGQNNDDYTALTSEQQKALVADRVYLRAQYPGEIGYAPPAALRNNRHEVEIMAACNLYSALKTNFGRMHPNDQVRNGLLEYEIQKLVDRYYAGEGLGAKDLSEFNLEARIM
jgi:hypothetical protein